MQEKGDWQTSFDLQNMYLHVRVHRSQWPLLGCQVESPEGEKVYFYFTLVIYGMKRAVHLATKLTRPIERKAAKMGIHDRQWQECEEKLQTVQDAGWNVKDYSYLKFRNPRTTFENTPLDPQNI